MAFPSLALVLSTAALMIGLCVRVWFRIAFLKTCSAIFIAGFASDKVFVKSLTAAICGTVFLLVILAIYVFIAHLKKYVLSDIT